MDSYQQQNNLYGQQSLPQHNLYPPITLKEWLITFLLVCIPMANFIFLITWAFSSDINPNKSNWAKATLIWMVIAALFAIIFYAVLALLILAPMMELLRM